MPVSTVGVVSVKKPAYTAGPDLPCDAPRSLENIVRIPSDAAAQEGRFSPCLRCRAGKT